MNWVKKCLLGVCDVSGNVGEKERIQNLIMTDEVQATNYPNQSWCIYHTLLC